jgi:hypothetical protein
MCYALEAAGTLWRPCAQRVAQAHARMTHEQVQHGGTTPQPQMVPVDMVHEHVGVRVPAPCNTSLAQASLPVSASRKVQDHEPACREWFPLYVCTRCQLASCCPPQVPCVVRHA